MFSVIILLLLWIQCFYFEIHGAGSRLVLPPSPPPIFFIILFNLIFWIWVDVLTGLLFDINTSLASQLRQIRSQPTTDNNIATFAFHSERLFKLIINSLTRRVNQPGESGEMEGGGGRQTNQKNARLLLRDFVPSRHIKMFPSAVQKKRRRGAERRAKAVCVSQIIAGMAPRRCAALRPSEHRGQS